MKLATECNNIKVKFSIINGLVASKVNTLFEKASIHTVSEDRVVQLISDTMTNTTI